MTSLSDLYLFFCKRCDCRPNTRFVEELKIDEKETRVFDFSKNFLGEKGIDPALETARNNMKLEVLNLAENYLNKEAILKLVKVAVRHPTLTSIDLSGNPIHLSCCKSLLYLLNKNPNIAELKLDGTDVVPAMKERIQRELEINRAKTQDERQKVLRYEAEHRKRKAEAPELLPGNVAVGEWKGETAGGCLTYTTWRENPQFLLYPAEEGVVTIEMRQRDQTDYRDKTQQAMMIGLTVVQGLGVQRVLSVKKGMIVGESDYTDDEKVRLSVRLDRRQKGKDVPYVIIATTVHPGREGKFSLTCLSQEDDNKDDVRYQIDAVDDSYDWFRTPRVISEWTDKTAGGSRRHTSWRHNQQYHLTFNERARRSVRMVILLAKAADEEDNDDRHIGFYVVAGQANKQRRIMLDPSEIVGEAKFVKKASVSLELEVDPRAEGYYIIPVTRDPGQKGPFTLTVYATSEVKLGPIDTSLDWPEYVINGEWDHSTNGGYRHRNLNSWMHNPSFSWNVDGPTDVLFCLERKGRGKSVRLAGAAFKGGKGADEMAVGMLITHDDDDFTTVKESEFVYDGESLLFLEGVRPKKGGFLVMPTTFDAGDHSNYTLRVYSSTPLRGGSLEEMKHVADRHKEKEIVQHDKLNTKKRAEPALPKALRGLKETKAPGARDDEVERVAAEQRDRIIEACKRFGRKHVDREFPAGETSLYFEPDAPPAPAPLVHTWKRPSEIMECPQLFDQYGGPSRVQVGHWNDAWLLGAFGLLAVQPDLLHDIFVCAYPEWGFYQVRFFRFGEWKIVTVDDFLPVDIQDGLVFARSSKTNEVWISILEKAYAKLQGSYQALREGAEEQAMMDFTAGPADVLRISEPGAAPVPLGKREETYAHIWDTIVEYDKAKWLLGCGSFDKNQLVEGNYGVGILYNKMYAITDCRVVQGQKLLRLRNPWGTLEWHGKWSDTSDLWTDELLAILDYKPGDDGTFWMSFADFCYFFNRMFLCRLPANLGAEALQWYGSWDGKAGGTEHHKTFLSNQQFAIETPDQTTETLSLYVVLSQRDALAPHGEYEDIGFYIIEGDDNTQKLKKITNKEVVHASGFTKNREIAATVPLLPSKKYIFIATTADPRRYGDYMVTMHCSMKMECKLISNDEDVTVEGKWRAMTAGGAPGVYGTWRLNTQYLIHPSQDSMVTLRLKQHPAPNMPPHPLPIGLLVLDGKQIKKTLEYDQKDVVASVGHEREIELSIQVPMQSMQSRGGRPYVVIPHTYFPNQYAGFTLTARCNKKLQIKQVDPDFDWVHTQVKGGWHQKANTAGGCLEYASWRENVQYHLQFADENCQIFVVLNKALPDGAAPDSNTNDFGFVIAKGSPIEAGRRPKLSITEDDIMLQAMGSTDNVIAKGSLPSNGLNDGYYIIPYTKYPDTEGAFVLDIYTSCEATAVPVRGSENWLCKTQAGEWVPGENAGGSRTVSRTWHNNPFYSLKMQYPTNVVVTLTQLPRAVGPDAFKAAPTNQAGLSVEKKNQKRLRRMPQTDREGNVPIGVDLCRDDEDTTILRSAPYSPATEIVLTLPALQVDEKPYILVPHSYETEHDAKYQLTVYSDLPVDLNPVVKGRRS